MFYTFPRLKISSRLIAAILLFCISLFPVVRFAPANASARKVYKSKTSAKASAAQTTQAPAYPKGEVLVRFRTGVAENDKDIVAGTYRAQRARQLRGESAIEKLQLSGDDDPTTTAQLMNLNPAVEFAEPNFVIAKDQINTTTPNDSRFPEQWALSNTGQNGGQYGSDIGVMTAWQKTTGSQSTVIAVVDSGIDFTHPDLANNEWTNPNPANGDTSTGVCLWFHCPDAQVWIFRLRFITTRWFGLSKAV